MKKNIMLMIIMIISIVILTGCTEKNNHNKLTDTQKLIGKWEWNYLNETSTYDFYQNNSLYSYYINHQTGETHKGWGKYEIKDQKLYCSTHHGHDGKEESFCYDYDFIEKNKLSLSSENLPTVILERIE